MTYAFGDKTYPRFLDLFCENMAVPLGELPPPPRLDFLPGRAQPPLGYLCEGVGEGRHFVPDPERAGLVAEAFRLVAEGTHFQDAWRRMVRTGLTGKSGKMISASGLRQVLGNPAYMGLLHYGSELYGAPFEPLVSEEMLKAARREMERQLTDFYRKGEERSERRCASIERLRKMGR